MSTAGSVTAVGVEMRGRWWQERRLVALEITARVDVPSRCRVALKSALPHFVWPTKGQRPKSDRLAPKVMALIEEGRSYRWIARDLGISKNTVLAIAQRSLVKNVST